MRKVYAVKWSADQPGLDDDKPFALGWARAPEAAADLGAAHFSVEADEVEVLDDVDREGEPCFYVSEKEVQSERYGP